MQVEKVTGQVFAHNDIDYPALALVEEEDFWRHPALSGPELYRLANQLGWAFSTHEPMLVNRAMERRASNHRRLERLPYFAGMVANLGGGGRAGTMPSYYADRPAQAA